MSITKGKPNAGILQYLEWNARPARGTHRKPEHSSLRSAIPQTPLILLEKGELASIGRTALVHRTRDRWAPVAESWTSDNKNGKEFEKNQYKSVFRMTRDYSIIKRN